MSLRLTSLLAISNNQYQDIIKLLLIGIKILKPTPKEQAILRAQIRVIIFLEPEIQGENSIMHSKKHLQLLQLKALLLINQKGLFHHF
jgi:hypothetical protein